jgi:hypothetical protein
MEKIRLAQGFVRVINEDNIDEVQEVFNIINRGLMP